MRVTLWRSEGEIVVGTFGAARVCSNGRSGCECDRKDASKKKTCHDEVFFFFFERSTQLAASCRSSFSHFLIIIISRYA